MVWHTAGCVVHGHRRVSIGILGQILTIEDTVYADDECVKRDLIYLCERGYVTWINEGPYVRWSERLYKITARGNEFVERMISDPVLEP
jgi:hypothetical protein